MSISKNIIDLVQSEKTVFFCGAGISINSGLPSAYNIVEKILKTIGASNEQIKIVEKSALPFEAFIQALSENSNIFPILEMFDLGEPNVNHIFLAKLAKSGNLNVICTTNFDTLIEKSCENEGLVRNIDFNVYSTDQQFDEIDWSNNEKLKIIKLHGTVEDKKSMSITLRQVSKHFLSNSRKKVVSNIFSGNNEKNTLVLGYSFSDIFDISPQIQSIQSNFNFICSLEHYPTPENQDKFSGMTENITLQNIKNPFKNFSNSLRLFYNTDSFIKEIWENLLNDPFPSFVRESTVHLCWEEKINNWLGNAEKQHFIGVNYCICACVFESISEFHISLNYWKLALEAAENTSNKKEIALCLNGISDAYFNIGDFNKATDSIERVIKIAIDLEDKKLERSGVSGLGRIHHSLGNYSIAKKHAKNALKFAKESRDKEGEAISLAGIGMIYHSLSDHERAKTYFEDALVISKDIGDKENEGICFGGIGNIYHRFKDYKKAKESYEAALKIAIEIGDREREASWSGNLAVLHRNMGEFEKSLEYHNEELRIAIATGDKESEGISLGNFGDYFLSQNDFDKAQIFYEKAFEIAKIIHDKEGESILLSNLGIIHSEFGRFQEAVECVEKSIAIAQEMGDLENTGFCFNDLGDIFQKMDELEKAKRSYTKSFDILMPVLGSGHPDVQEIKNKILLF